MPRRSPPADRRRRHPEIRRPGAARPPPRRRAEPSTASTRPVSGCRARRTAASSPPSRKASRACRARSSVRKEPSASTGSPSPGLGRNERLDGFDDEFARPDPERRGRGDPRGRRPVGETDAKLPDRPLPRRTRRRNRGQDGRESGGPTRRGRSGTQRTREAGARHGRGQDTRFRRRRYPTGRRAGGGTSSRM